jgi:hypothetical protein
VCFHHHQPDLPAFSVRFCSSVGCIPTRAHASLHAAFLAFHEWHGCLPVLASPFLVETCQLGCSLRQLLKWCHTCKRRALQSLHTSMIGQCTLLRRRPHLRIQCFQSRGVSFDMVVLSMSLPFAMVSQLQTAFPPSRIKVATTPCVVAFLGGLPYICNALCAVW